MSSTLSLHTVKQLSFSDVRVILFLKKNKEITFSNVHSFKKRHLAVLQHRR